MLVKFEQSRTVWSKLQNFELFDQKKKKKKKNKFFNTIFDKALMAFWQMFLYLKLVFNA